MKAVSKYTHNKSSKKNLAQRDELIIKYAPLIKFIANRIAIRLPSHIDIQDMINSGVLGLIDAIEKFDPSRGVKFETYAEFRIKGAILDELRAMDWVPRSVRKVATWLENTCVELEKKLGRPPTEEEIACAMEIDIDKLHEIISLTGGISLLSLEMVAKNTDSKRTLMDYLMDEESKNPFSRLRLEELKDLVAECIEMLPEKEKLVISLYYYDELTMKEIGRVLNLTESRVSQIHTKATIRLRGKLRRMLHAV